MATSTYTADTLADFINEAKRSRELALSSSAEPEQKLEALGINERMRGQAIEELVAMSNEEIEDFKKQYPEFCAEVKNLMHVVARVPAKERFKKQQKEIEELKKQLAAKK